MVFARISTSIWSDANVFHEINRKGFESLVYHFAISLQKTYMLLPFFGKFLTARTSLFLSEQHRAFFFSFRVSRELSANGKRRWWLKINDCDAFKLRDLQNTFTLIYYQGISFVGQHCSLRFCQWTYGNVFARKATDTSHYRTKPAAMTSSLIRGGQQGMDWYQRCVVSLSVDHRNSKMLLT